jgi:predicted ATPase
MLSTTFIGRENELRRLQHFLDRANAGRGQVVFVAGEAGVGKSALIHEFIRHAEETDAAVVAAIGQCNAQTGVGDPYLPFREVLMVLTGADDEKQTRSVLNPTNAARLREFARVSGETIIDVAPDLIGIFVPGASLLAKIASKAAQSSKLIDKLTQTLPKPGQYTTNPHIKPELDQEKIFQQYTKALQALSVEHTLLLVLDDLQWADSASLNLLFHLARQLHDSHVLLVGAYRPGDVALGRGGERHPLEPIVNELRRYQGDIVLDLDETHASEGRTFVDALIDAKPNLLDTTFRNELFARTGGHPLFTIELLRNLQERGALVQNIAGQWVIGATLDWEILPARIEGVIEERIARLTYELRETLTIGSVMGVDFTAQVIGRVQQIQERALFKNLARELDKRHHLVQEEGETKVGRQIFSWYRFTHALVQQFLYGELSAGERRLMHGDVAEALEALYEGHTDAVEIQLAQHYQEAGDDEKAIVYLIRAGDSAFNAYAQQEAIAHYTRALELGAQSGLTDAQCRHLYSRRGQAYELVGAFEAALNNYSELEQVGRTRHDRLLELEALMLRAALLSIGTRVWDLNQAKTLSFQALALARELAARQAEARIHWTLMLLNRYSHAGFDKAIEYGEQSIALARDLALREQLALSLKDIAVAYWQNGQLQQGQQAVEEAVPLWRDLNNKLMLAETLAYAGLMYGLRGELERARRAIGEAYTLNKSLDNRFGLYTSAALLAAIYRELGQVDQYLALLAEAKRCAEEVGAGIAFGHLLLMEAWDLAWLGDVPSGIAMVQQAAAYIEQIAPEMLVAPKATLARLYLCLGNVAAAQEILKDVPLASFAEYLSMLLTPHSVVWMTLVHAELALAQGDTARALQIAGDLMAYLQHMEAKLLLPEVLHVQADALRAQQRSDEAYVALTQAKQLAEVMSSRWRLWSILAALAELDMERGNPVQSEELRAQARAGVDSIVQTLPPNLQATFLNAPVVQSLQKRAIV